MDRNASIDAETYFYGAIVGVKRKENGEYIGVMQTDGKLMEVDYGDVQPAISVNIIGIRAKSRQNVISGEHSEVKFVEKVPYNPVYDSEDIAKRAERGAKVWAGVDVDKFIDGVRRGK
jgi:hypothetical protein